MGNPHDITTKKEGIHCKKTILKEGGSEHHGKFADSTCTILFILAYTLWECFYNVQTNLPHPNQQMFMTLSKHRSYMTLFSGINII